MRTWGTVQQAMPCGGCGATIAAGGHAQCVELPGVTRKMFRGECCVGPAPPPLPARIVSTERTKRMQPIGRVASSLLASNKNLRGQRRGAA